MRLPTCTDCPFYLHFGERIPRKQNGVLMKPGERYCLGRKKAIHFSAKDPKKYPPAWCPKRKSPCEVRVYGFKSTRDWYFHNRLCLYLGKNILPDAARYCVEQEIKTELTPKRFWEALEDKFLSELLPVTVSNYGVIEIDDGLKPICFYKTENNLMIAPCFDTVRARANKKEEDT